MKRFYYYHKIPPQKKSKNSKFVLIDAKLIGKQELLSTYHEKFEFPDYFGFNWDALYDSLLDLSWIKENDIDIIHFDLSNITLDEKKIYLNILVDAKNNWDQEKSHQLNIYFPEVLKIQIEKLLD